MAKCEFFYDFSSPFAYLGATQIARVCEGHELVWRPFLLGALFNEIGTPTVPLSTFPAAKQRLALIDQYRWADHWGVAFKFPSRFPQLSVKALRLALQAPADKVEGLSRALFEIVWVNDGDINDEAALRAALEGQGLDADAMLAGTKNPEIKDMLRKNTAEAVERGVVGAPTSIVTNDGGEHVFWGQDRFEFVRKALDGWTPELGELPGPVSADV